MHIIHRQRTSAHGTHWTNSQCMLNTLSAEYMSTCRRRHPGRMSIEVQITELQQRPVSPLLQLQVVTWLVTGLACCKSSHYQHLIYKYSPADLTRSRSLQQSLASECDILELVFLRSSTIKSQAWNLIKQIIHYLFIIIIITTLHLGCVVLAVSETVEPHK